MDEKLYSEAMITLDMDMEMFGLVAESIKCVDHPLYTEEDYREFYDILKNKDDYTDDILNSIIRSRLGMITLMVTTWAQVCNDTKRKIDKKEFCNTFLTLYDGE